MPKKALARSASRPATGDDVLSRLTALLPLPPPMMEDTSTRKHNPAALAAAQVRLLEALEAARVMAFQWDVASDSVTRSPSAAAILGLDPAEAIYGAGTQYFMLVHPEDRDSFLATLGRLNPEAPNYCTRYRLQKSDRRPAWVEDTGSGAFDAAGKLARVSGFCRDVTAQAKAEMALRESEERLRQVLEGVTEGFVILDKAFRVVSINAEGLRMDGRPATDIVGRTHWEVWPASVGTPVEAAYRRAMAERVPVALEHHYHDATHNVWLDIRAVPAPDGLALFYRNITDRKRTEAALAESEASFRAMADAMPQFAFTASPNGQLDFINQRWCEYTGQTREYAQELGVLEALHREDRARSLDTWAARMADGDSFEIEQRIRGADGIYRWFLARAAPLRDGESRILKWFGTVTDISEIVAAREASARSTEELEHLVSERTRALTEAARALKAEMRRREETQSALLQSQKLEALGQVTGSISHDFNNVLAAVQGCLQLLLRRVGSDPKIKQLIEEGLGAAGRGARLIGQLMAFARKEAPTPAVLDPAALLESMLDMVRHAAGKSVQCIMSTAPGTWAVIADALRLEMVLLNLATNARDAMPNGGQLSISIRNADAAELPPTLAANQQWVLISVADTGSGMDAVTLHKATEPFFTTKRPGLGTGLGLASVDEFARISGGALRMQSALGNGTTVELFLPRAAVEPTPSVARDDLRHGSARLLVVDDDAGVRSVVAGMLVELGYEVVQAASAEAAEAAVHEESGRIDMLVTDVLMDGAHGGLLAERLRAERPDLAVLFITGHEGSVNLGDAPVLRKPFTEGALARAVLHGLGRLTCHKKPR